MRITIRSRILSIVVGGTLIQVLLMGAFFLHQYNKSQHNLVNQQLRTVSETLGAQISFFFNSTLHDLEIENHSALVPYETLQQFIEQTILPTGMNVLILNNEGKVLAQTLHNRKPYSAFPVDQQWDGDIVIDQVRYISLSSPLGFHGQDFTLIATIDSQNSLFPNGHFFLLLSFLIVLILILSMLVTLASNKKIIPPLQLLANDSTTMAKSKEVDNTAPKDACLEDSANAMNSVDQQLQEANISLVNEIRLKSLEEKIAVIAKTDAEKANQAKSLFLANMSHEIRTSLHGMIAMLEMIGKDHLTSEQNRLLSMTTLSGKRLNTVVNSILDFSQIESGKFQLHHSPFSLSELITEVVELMMIQTENKEIKISSNQSAEIPDTLIGDSGRIRQILINLISNSIKFSKNGEITLKIDLESRPSEKEVELLFSVQDEGNGISEDARQTIFDAFDRGGIEKNGVVEGIGLGLAISSEFVEHMHGKLWLAKSDKNGSTFCFTIHCDVVLEKKLETAEQIDGIKPAKQLAGITIFLAEDEFINQRIISAYLEEQGCSVTVCANGRELLDTLKEEAADIILMDIHMPVLNGLETTKIIRKMEKDSAHPPIPIVALTAQATTEFEEKCRMAGMNDYLTKPIPLKKLVSIIYGLAGKDQLEQ